MRSKKTFDYNYTISVINKRIFDLSDYNFIDSHQTLFAWPRRVFILLDEFFILFTVLCISAMRLQNICTCRETGSRKRTDVRTYDGGRLPRKHNFCDKQLLSSRRSYSYYSRHNIKEIFELKVNFFPFKSLVRSVSPSRWNYTLATARELICVQWLLGPGFERKMHYFLDTLSNDFQIQIPFHTSEN